MKKIIDEFGIKVNETVNIINDIVGEAFNMGQAAAIAAILNHLYISRDNHVPLEQVVLDIQNGHMDNSDMAELIGRMIKAIREEKTT